MASSYIEWAIEEARRLGNEFIFIDATNKALLHLVELHYNKKFVQGIETIYIASDNPRDCYFSSTPFREFIRINYDVKYYIPPTPCISKPIRIRSSHEH